MSFLYSIKRDQVVQNIVLSCIRSAKILLKALFGHGYYPKDCIVLSVSLTLETFLVSRVPQHSRASCYLIRYALLQRRYQVQSAIDKLVNRYHDPMKFDSMLRLC